MNFTTVLSSPYLLYTTSITSLIIARLIVKSVKKNGPIPLASKPIKYNSIFYSISSLCLCLAIGCSLWTEISQPYPSLHSIICSPSSAGYDLALRYIYHASKIYEYVDIFNVLAAGGAVNAHFGFHHFTTPYLTNARTIQHPAGWKIFAFLNTLHHAFMYAHFGGAEVFSELLPVTGCLQLFVGILGEFYVMWTSCAGREAMWANWLAMGLLGVYAVLFAGDLRERGRERKRKEKGFRKKIE